MRYATGTMSAALRTSAPATIVTSTWLAVRFLGHDAAAAAVIAGLTGLLTSAAAVLACAEVQKTVQTWIRHRASAKGEIIRAKSEAQNSRSWTETHNAIVRAGLKSPESAERVEGLLRMHNLARVERKTEATRSPSPAHHPPALARH